MEATTYAPGKGEWRRAANHSNGSAQFLMVRQLPEQANREFYDALDLLEQEIEGVSVWAVDTQRLYSLSRYPAS